MKLSLDDLYAIEDGIRWNLEYCRRSLAAGSAEPVTEKRAHNRDLLHRVQVELQKREKHKGRRA